ncbi:unnamed protein product [Nezara viridula]|uniref:Uncharacterized protein n=1 Tax=Nezara viridula TaxID=85310 RepID=A0A9P0E760_NEZVI|nr:unnamed protein product [Nezara viridula]
MIAGYDRVLLEWDLLPSRLPLLRLLHLLPWLSLLLQSGVQLLRGSFLFLSIAEKMDVENEYSGGKLVAMWEYREYHKGFIVGEWLSRKET